MRTSIGKVISSAPTFQITGGGGGKTQELSTPFILLHGEKPGMWGGVLTQNEG